MNFMIRKHTAGMRMINEEAAYQEASMNAVTLTGDLYTEAISYDNAIAAARILTTQGSRWAEAANLYYPLTPNTNANRRWMIELIGPMEVLQDYDYANLKQDIMNNEDRGLTAYRPASNINSSVQFSFILHRVWTCLD